MIAIISDIHGNYEALKQVLAKLDEMKISQIFCLGDIVGYYSEINECCDELRRRDVKCVMGNHDWYMASGSSCSRSRSVNDCMEFQRRIIRKENKKWITTLPIIINNRDLSMVHGGWNNPIDEYLEDLPDYFKNIEGRFFVSGHTHVQIIKDFGGKFYCNPGSVGQPRDGDNRAAFAIFDGIDFQLYRVEYDVKKVGRLMDLAGFDSYYYGCLNDASPNLHR